MRRRAFPDLFLAAALLAGSSTIACGGGSGGAGGGSNPDGGTTGTVTCSGTAVVASEANDYRFSSTLTFPPIAVAPNMELTFDWGGVTADLIGHAVDPHTNLNTISILMWNLTLADLQTKLNADSLQQRDLVVVPPTFFPDGSATSARLFDFALNGNPIEPATILTYFDATAHPPATNTYTLMAATGTTLGQGTRMIQSFRLDPASTNTNVTMTSTSTHLAYTADLHTLKATGIMAGQAAVSLDWSHMTTNALGNPFIATNVTSVLVAHYTQSPAALEAQFLDLELIATDLFRGCVGDAPCTIPNGTRVEFSALKNAAGQSFTGIDDSGTWIVALQCGGCRNPAPWYLSVLKPCGN